MECRFCKKENDSTVKYCRFCGASQTDDSIRYDYSSNGPAFFGQWKMQIILFLAVLVLCIGSGFAVKYLVLSDKTDSEAKVSADKEKSEEADTSDESDTSEGTLSQKEILQSFLDDKNTISYENGEYSFTELQNHYNSSEIDYDYKDMDNDGDDELILFAVDFYGGLVIDVKDSKPYVKTGGEGTANFFTIHDVDGETWVCHSDTTHQGRNTYFFEKYSGDEVADSFDLSAEYWDNENDVYDKNSDFTYKGESVTMEKYEEVLAKYTGWHEETEDDDIINNIDDTSASDEDYTTVLHPSEYAFYQSDRGSSKFNFYYPLGLYESVTHEYDLGETNYGDLKERVVFTGANGSSLEYAQYRRTDSVSVEGIVADVTEYESDDLVNVTLQEPSAPNGKAQKAIYGMLRDDTDNGTYVLVSADSKYVYIMKMIMADFNSSSAGTYMEEKSQKSCAAYYNECIYRMTGFCFYDGTFRPYSEFYEASKEW
jgi:hypothetical protein